MNLFKKKYNETNLVTKADYNNLIKELNEIRTKLNDITDLSKKVDECIAFGKLNALSLNKGSDLQSISKDVFANYPKAVDFLRDVQNCNLRLMIDFKTFCDNLNVKFWLHAGTLIGALRNNGFIQWDDDVDVGMTRTDFDIVKKTLDNNDLLQLCEYYNEVTCSRQYQLKYRKYDIPVFIDIVVYDKCLARTPNEQNMFWDKYRTIRANLIDKFIKELGAPKIIDIGYYKVGLYDGKTKENVDKIIDDAVLQTSDTAAEIDNPSYFYSIQNYPFTYPIMKYEDLYPLETVLFEENSFYIPKNAEYYLWGYGNIWLPPKDIGQNQHLYVIEKYKEQIKKFLEK